jgi:N-hydroxyarylamine O-acetyltransferase
MTHTLDAGAYLDRIGFDGPRPTVPDLATLRALHRAHLLTVPFENLDIHIGRPIVLDLAALERKLVGERRGGFCYELNGSFAALLRQLGYEVSLMEARVRKADGKSFGPPFDHLLLRVRCQDDPGPWLADVGFGDSFMEPLRLEPGTDQAEVTGHWRIEAVDGDLELRRRAGDADRWDAEHRFGTYAHELASFAAMCRYHQTSPKSPFTQRRVCSLATPAGRLTLRDDRLIVTDAGQRSERPIDGAAAFEAALREHFGVVLPAQRAEPARRARPAAG